MSNPLRQQRKSFGNVELSAAEIHSLKDRIYPLRFETTPYDGTPPFEVDLVEFHDGRQASPISTWKGPIAGRPQLLNDLLPYFYEECRSYNLRHWTRIKTVLRSLWRLIDELPDAFKVDRLSDLSDAHGFLLRKNQYYESIITILIRSREYHHLPPLLWPRAHGRADAILDCPDEVTTRRLYRAIKSEARQIVAMWGIGDDLINGAFREPYCSDHQLMRALVDNYATPLPQSAWDVPAYIRKNVGGPEYQVPRIVSVEADTASTGNNSLSSPDGASTGIIAALRWLYPTVWETTCLLLLFLILTGWNLGTALNLRLNTGRSREAPKEESDDRCWAFRHPMDDKLMALYAIKTKNGTRQTAISLTKPELHAYRIIKLLEKRTDPLRQELRRRMRELERAIDDHGLSSERERERVELSAMIASPWLYLQGRNVSGIGCLLHWKPIKYPGAVLRGIIEKHSIVDAAGEPPQIKSKDFRDAWIGFAYATSGHSWLVAKVAAGHRSSASLRAYLGKMRWRRQGQRAVVSVLDAAWREIRARRIVDGAILRQMVEVGEITEEQRRRLADHRNRTRMRMGCTGFTTPPEHIAPGHPAGTGCMVQRCIICTHGILFAESIDGLCRRQAELEHIQRTIPATSWIESSFPDEWETLELSLKLFEICEVVARVEIWRTKIASGLHKVFYSQGYYGIRS